MQSTSASITVSADKGATTLNVNSTAGFAAGDYIRLSQNDSALVASAWALGSVGQLVQINSISSNTIFLNSPLRKNYSLTDVPKITRLQPATGSGIECLSIKRLDASSWQSSNIRIENAAKCWVKNIESDSTNFAHVNITSATNIQVTGSNFHGAFAYGGSGQGYGVVLQSTSGECLVENNTFQHLRHSMLLQSGANGNVLSYNYSTQPYWSDASPVIPTDAAGDMVLHGNWPYANLFEGNYGQNMIIDNSHGVNGPFNTFFRNRGANYGLFMNVGAGDSSNLMGNEITNITNGMYMLTGSGNLEWANRVRGVIFPALTLTLNEASLYRSSPPEFFSSSYPYPSFGPPNTAATNTTVPAGGIDTDSNGCCCNTTYQVLPIALQQFTANASNCNALLQWTATDDDGDNYTIETSIDTRNFSSAKTAIARGGQTQNNYSFTLLQAATKTWYRLKMTSRDGSISYSPLKAVSSHCTTQNNLVVAPNPVGNIMNLQYTAAQAEKAIVWMMDATGKTVLKTILSLQVGTNNLPVNVQSLVPGIYQVGISKTSGEILSTTQKVIKGVAVN